MTLCYVVLCDMCYATDFRVCPLEMAEGFGTCSPSEAPWGWVKVNNVVCDVYHGLGVFLMSIRAFLNSPFLRSDKLSDSGKNRLEYTVAPANVQAVHSPRCYPSLPHTQGTLVHAGTL